MLLALVSRMDSMTGVIGAESSLRTLFLEKDNPDSIHALYDHGKYL
jgi:hypothetical protein